MRNSNAALKAGTAMSVEAKFTGPDSTRRLTGVNDNSLNPSKAAIAQDASVQAIKKLMKLAQAAGHPMVIRVEITPVAAAWLLGKNAHNRRVSEPKILQYCDDLENKRWVENGDGISIAQCGAMNNGQHRCLSVIASGICFMTNVTVGLTRESRATNDIGLTRSLSSLLAMDGIDNHTIIGPMTKLIIGWEATGTAAKRPTRENSPTRVQERIDGDNDIAYSAAYSRTVKSRAKGVLSPAQIGFFHFFLSKISPVEAESFLTAVATNAEGEGKEERGLSTSDTRYLLRARLIRDNKHLKHADRVELVFRAWNAWREGRDVTIFKIMGTIPELV